MENKKFVCEVNLPENSPVLCATGKPSSKKAIAKRSAAFEACLILRQKDHLDSNLLPTYHKMLPQMRNAHLALNTNKSKAYIMKIKPSLWERTRGSQPDNLYLTILELENPENLGRPCQPLALLTRTRLPDFPPFLLYLQVDKTSNVLCNPIMKSIEVDNAALRDLTEFTLRIYRDIYNKKYEVNEPGMSYWLAPIVRNWKLCTPNMSPERLIEWEIVKDVCRETEIAWSIDTPLDQLTNRYLVDRWDGGRRFFSTALEPHMHPLDPVPDDAAAHKYMKNILDYSVSLFAKSRLRATWRHNQPVIRADRVLHRLNWLEDFNDKEKVAKTRSYLCPEPLLFSRVCMVLTHILASYS